MGLNFSSFSIRGIDVSSYNGTIDWSKANCHFAGIRAGYGRTIDKFFQANWKNAKGKVKRIPYWYMDYYSNHNAGSSVNGKSDADWGKEQAENLWAVLKDDPEGIVFLDIENGSATYAPAISTVAARAQAIAKAFLDHMDTLNGKKNGIYCSLSMTTWFSAWFKDRPLWVAWYNEAQTIQTVQAALTKNGWNGKCLIWQYASDGDINDDGSADGISMGMQYKFLDLNAWMGSSADFTALFSGQVPVPPDNPVEEIDNPPAALYKVKILINNLLIRSGPGMLYSRLRRADFPAEYSVYEEQNNYGRISATAAEWISLSPSYVQKIGSTPVVEPADAEKLARLWAAHPELH